MRFSSFVDGFVFLIGAEVERGFAAEELIFVGLTERESIEDETFEFPVRSLLLLFVDVCD